MDEQLIGLYQKHVAAAFDRQLRLADYLRQKGQSEEWEYQVSTATLTLGKLKFEAPILGSHSFANHSWLWAWSNKNLKLTLTNRALGDLVRVTAHRVGAHQLAGQGFSLEPLLGPELTERADVVFGMVFSRELDYDAYYTAPFEGGRFTLLIRDDRLKFTERYPLHRVLAVFPQVISALPVFDHRAALDAYAHTYGLGVSAVPGGLKIADGKGGELTATFDDHDRLTNLHGTGVAVPPVKKALKAAKKRTPKAYAKKATAKRTSAVKKPTAKKVTAKKPAAKPAKAVVKKAAPLAKSTKVTAKKVTAKKPAVKKVSAKKAVAKRPAKSAARSPGNKR